MSGENQRRRSSSRGEAGSERSGVADDSKPPAARAGSPPGRASSGADRGGSPSGDGKSSGREDSTPARPPSGAGAGAEQPRGKATPPASPSSSRQQQQPKGGEERGAEGGEPAEEEDRRQGRRGRQEQQPPHDAGVEKGAEHFKMVAARFRALMERRERRLEEAMSNPDTRRDLEVMFPGVRDGDYQTLLACVRGMGEEEDFQNLLDAARKRRREVRGIFVFFGFFVAAKEIEREAWVSH